MIYTLIYKRIIITPTYHQMIIHKLQKNGCNCKYPRIRYITKNNFKCGMCLITTQIKNDKNKQNFI